MILLQIYGTNKQLLNFCNFDFNTYINDPEYTIYIFVDGINGIQYSDQSDYKRKLLSWANFIEEYSENHSNVNFIISSREVREIEYFHSQKQRKVYIQPLELQQAKEFIKLFAKSEADVVYSESIINEHSGLPFVFIA